MSDKFNADKWNMNEPLETGEEHAEATDLNKDSFDKSQFVAKSTIYKVIITIAILAWGILNRNFCVFGELVQWMTMFVIPLSLSAVALILLWNKKYIVTAEMCKPSAIVIRLLQAVALFALGFYFRDSYLEFEHYSIFAWECIAVTFMVLIHLLARRDITRQIILTAAIVMAAITIMNINLFVSWR